MEREIECPYSARVIDTIDNGKGYWQYLLVGVFEGDKKIGEYKRNYSCFYNTFHPFQAIDGSWLALYSRDYTSTRVMALPSCEDLGGEDRNAVGFCPVDYMVPELCGQELSQDDPGPIVANWQPEIWADKVVTESGYTMYKWPDQVEDHPKREAYLKAKEESHKLREEWRKRNPFVLKYAQWGFVAGCVWGDDCSWKIQFLDLSRAHEGVIIRDERFGYIELPDGVKLEDAIDVERIENLNAPLNEQIINIALPATFTLDGKRHKRWYEKV